MESDTASTAVTSFILKVEIRGLILLEQLTTGQNPGIHLIIPIDHHHPHTASMEIDNTVIPVPSRVDLYHATASTAGKVQDMAILSDILGAKVKVKRTATGAPVSAVKASIRLPLPQGEIVGDEPFVQLGFRLPSGPTHHANKVGGRGRFDVRILGSSITVGNHVFTATGQTMNMKIENMPGPPDPCYQVNHQFGVHHTDAVYPLLDGNPAPPAVTLRGRITPCPAPSHLKMLGVDPAQCWPPTV